MKYLKRLWPLILSLAMLLISSLSFAASSYVVEMQRSLTESEQAHFAKEIQGRVARFAEKSISPSKYFSRLYSVETDLPMEALQKLSWAVKVETVSQLQSFGLTPGHENISNDALSSYQWALKNSGQIVNVDEDDITTISRAGLAGADIHWGNVSKRMLPKNPLVAVIDYGLDINHPDLKEHIFKNQRECVNDAIPLNPSEDKDGNSYKGDCSGWNFTTGKEGSNRVVDDSGHGTHVAGIIAALSGNQMGMSGVHSQIRILPLQVLKKATAGQDFSSRSDWLAKAILYAVRMKADVINMSLGWPLFMDQQYLREAVAEALRQGVVIVAAAGNNNHSAPIFPCAYQGVICVGSINNDGRISSFSNFGGQVDIVAPGDNILSLLPMNMQPDYFSVQGYELKSGTSQAAPYVSATAALIKALHPDWTVRQILANLLKTAKPIQEKEKHISGGLLQAEEALEGNDQILVRPILKESHLVLANISQKSFAWSMPVENLSNQSVKAKIQIHSSNARVRIKLSASTVHLKPWQSQNVLVEGIFASPEDSNEIPLDINIIAGNQNWRYHHQVELARDMSHDLEVQRLVLPSELSLGLRTLSARGVEKRNIYYTQKTEDKQTHLIFYELMKSSMQRLGDIKLSQVSQILSLNQTDKNQDGIVDFEIQAVVLDGEKKSIHFFHFTDRLQPLFGDMSDWLFEAETSLLPMEGVESISYQDPVLGLISLPVFMADGKLPKADQNQVAWTPPDLSIRSRLYFLEPKVENGKVRVVTRVLDSEANLSLWKNQLGLSFHQDIRVLFQLPGQALILSVGEGFARRAFVLKYVKGAQGWKFQIEALSGAPVLDGYSLDSAFDLLSGKADHHLLIGQYSSKRWDVFGLGKTSVDKRQSLTPAESSETLQVYIKSFVSSDKTYSFTQTPSSILLQTTNSQGLVEKQSYPFHVSTFISQEIFSEQAHPLMAVMGGQLRPALMVDSSQITAQHLFLLTLAQGQLIVPIKTSLHIPAFCQPMNPISAGPEAQGQLLFLCSPQGKDLELWTLPLK